MGKIKGCINQDCSAKQKKTKYKETETICPECGRELSFVCPKCFTVLQENDGKYCIRCAEGKKDMRDKVLKVGGTVLSAVATLAVTIVGTVASIIDTSDKKE
jgi:hypothetical protein